MSTFHRERRAWLAAGLIAASLLPCETPAYMGLPKAPREQPSDDARCPPRCPTANQPVLPDPPFDAASPVPWIASGDDFVSRVRHATGVGEVGFLSFTHAELVSTSLTALGHGPAPALPTANPLADANAPESAARGEPPRIPRLAILVIVGTFVATILIVLLSLGAGPSRRRSRRNARSSRPIGAGFGVAPARSRYSCAHIRNRLA